MEPIGLLFIIVAVFVAWLIIRQVWKTITCTIRMLFYAIIVAVILYVIGSYFDWPIISQIDGIIANMLEGQ